MILRDPVHGLISFAGARERLLMRLMDTKEVQRLRRIRALGLASLAFPGGEHSRFAHAIGSAYVMRRYLERVWDLSGELDASERIDDQTELIALCAALLHDLGHGPYSHTFETLLPNARRHELWTSQILLDPDTEVHAVLRELDPQAPKIVDRLIHGAHPIGHLSRAVSGTFDVDRCDYLLRDSHMTGVRYGTLDLDWLLQSLRLHRAPGAAQTSLAVDGEKGLTAVEGFFLARLHMYRQVYLHKAVRAAEVMVRALFARLREIDPPEGTPAVLAKLLRGETLSTGDYLSLDDTVLETTWAHYEDARDPHVRVLARGIRHRRLFKTHPLPRDLDDAAVARVEALLRDQLEPGQPSSFAVVDRIDLRAYEEDEALVVVNHDNSTTNLLEASPLLHGLSSERFVVHRAVFPATARPKVHAALSAEFGGSASGQVGRGQAQ